MVSVKRKQSPVPAPVRKKAVIDYQFFQHAKIQGISEAVEAKLWHTRLIWLVVVLIANVACCVHMYFLILVFLEDKHETAVTFEQQNWLIPPRVLVCQPETRLLDRRSFTEANISAEYYYALELGIGLIHFNELNRLAGFVNMTQVEIYHYQTLFENNGSAATAYRNFHQKHMRKCEDIFRDCNTELYHAINCCDVFEPVFTLYGMCYVTKKDVINITGSDSMANFRFRVQFAGSELPNFFHNMDKPNNFVAGFTVGFVDGLDQGNLMVEYDGLLPADWLTVHMVQKQRLLLPSDTCLQDDYKLKFFQEYTRSNCRWERALMENLKPLSQFCEPPFVELLNASYISNLPCNLTEIFALFNYEKGEEPPVYGEEFVRKMEEASPSEIFPFIVEHCDVFKNRSDLPACTYDVLMSFHLPSEANRLLHPFANTRPFALEQLLVEILKKNESIETSCQSPLCNTTLHALVKSKSIGKQQLRANEASVTLQYTTKEVETVTESKKTTFAEWLSLIGGNIGMWNGASIVALVHLMALSVGAFGFWPLREQPQAGP